MFEAVTHNIRVEVRPEYVQEESDPSQSFYFFVYYIKIENQGAKKIKLLSRHWIITDAYGKVEEVKGDGVVGLQPELQPGDVFEYSSYCPLPTPTGYMEGTYLMKAEDTDLEVKIPRFVLCEPNSYH